MNITRSELFTAYNHARHAARMAGNNPKEIERINRALGILQSKAYYAGERAEYSPSPRVCGCKDWEYHYAAKRAYKGPCKHMWAEALTVQALQDRESRNVTAWIEYMAEMRANAEA